jgi:quercetin dioxygenase-like cupin family protein
MSETDPAVPIRRFDARSFDPAKLQKLNLFQTPRFFLDVYCLLPGQAQKPHQHADADKVYAVLEGTVTVRIGSARATLAAGEAALAPAGQDHGVENTSQSPAALLVFMAPSP